MDLREIGLIDNRNERIWKELNKTHSISVEIFNFPYYACNSKDDLSEILVPENDIDADSFTHEMLHIYIRQKQIFFGSSFRNYINGNDVLLTILNDQLLEHLSNCFDHIKMLPIYLNLGFDEKKFISDYSIDKCTGLEILQLKENFKIQEFYYGDAVNFYIGKYIAMKADPNQNMDYSKSLIELKMIDFNLFEILEKCVEDWNNMPLERENIWDDDYRSISSNLYYDLSKWVEGKVFV